MDCAAPKSSSTPFSSTDVSPFSQGGNRPAGNNGFFAAGKGAMALTGAAEQAQQVMSKKGCSSTGFACAPTAAARPPRPEGWKLE
jgi:hypothetical protein